MKDRDVSYANLDPVCVKTLICGMSSLARVAERIVRTELSERFGLILNGWTHASKYYIAVYADNDESGVVKTLLCMIPLLNEEEEDLSARGHMEFLVTMLPEDYGGQIESAAFW
ncbi:hypothetical protein F443_18898 [Phytophthora nicotianae P1569]|uniref:Uncharacterized protein n=2 Tax=Phytophthora nicotianae TaxID=4792 RepID=V9E6M1_PHYNI|nr:hypothetical protein F443_18898 [Phytophthora nicotianae P1569]